jgi:hypothetical protein
MLHSRLFAGAQTDGDPARNGEIAMVMVPMVSAAPDTISPDKINRVKILSVWNYLKIFPDM